MAGEIPPLEVQVVLNTAGVSAGVAQAQAGLQKVSVAAEETGAKVSAAGKSMAGAFLGLAAIAGAISLLRNSVKAAEDAQVATAQLSTTMNNAKLNTEANRTAIEKSTLSMQNLGFKSAETETAFSKLIATTHSVSESTKLMSMVADLARFKHESLGEAAVTLARGTTGSARAFREFGIVLDSHIPKNQAIAKAFDELNKKIGGDASSYAETFAGKMQVMGAKMESVKETIGGALIPILSTLMGAFTRVIETIKPILPVLTVVLLAIGSIVAAVKIWEMVTKAFTAVQAALDVVLNANPIMLVVAAIALLVAGFVIAWNHSEAFRRIVVDVMQAVVRAIGWVIGAIGEIVMAFIKFESGPLKAVLGALSWLPGIGGAAKSALKEIGNVTNDVGNFFDGAKKKVDSFANGMDSLVKRTDTAKKSLLEISGGNSSGGSLGIEGLVPGGGVSKGAAKLASAHAKHLAAVAKNIAEINKLYEQQATVLQDRQTKMTDANQKRLDSMANAQRIFDDRKSDLDRTHSEAFARAKEAYDSAIENAQTSHDDRLKTIDDDYQSKIADMFVAHNDKLLKLQDQYADNALKLQQSASDKRQGIIQQSIDAITNTWQSATKLDLMSLFGEGGNTGAGLVTTLKDRLTKVLKLQKDAGDLHAAGYSQGFIDQIIAKGPLIGDAMAQSILKASPDATSQIQALYGQIQNVSSNGLDALATQMNDGTKFATDKMADQYAQVSVTLQKSLADNSAKLNDALSTENDAYVKALDSASDAHTKALALNQTALVVALSKAREAQTKAQAAADQVLKDGMATATRTLTDSLASAQNAYNAAIKAISNSTNKQLDALMAKIDATAAKLRGLGAVVPSNPNAGLTPYSPVTSSGALMSGTTGTATGTATTPAQSDPSSIGRVRDSYTVNQSFGAPTVSPYELQRAMVDAITLRRVQ